MAEYSKLARFYLLLLAIFSVGRWLQGVVGIPYERGHQSIFYGAFCRRWLGYRPGQALVLGLLLGLASQIVIFAATLLSYGLGMHTYFNNPRALNVEAPIALGEALLRRLGGLFFNSFSNGIAGALGWAMGGLLPADLPAERRP
jgi:hypothetical protein